MSDLFTFDSLNQQFQELNKLTQNEQETEKEAGKLTEGTSILPVLPIVSELYGKGVQVAGKLQQAYTQFQKVGQAADAARAKAFNLAKQVRQQPTAEEEQPAVEEQPFTASVNEGGVELTDLSSLGRTVQGGLDAGIGSETSLESPLSSVVSDTLGTLRSTVGSAVSDTVGTLRSTVGSAVSDTVGTLRSTVGSIVQPETDISTLNSLLPSGAGSYVDLSGTAQGLQDVARGALSDAQGSLRTGMSALQGVGEDALTSLQQTAQGALSSVQQTAQGALSSVQQTSAAVASGLEGAAADASSAVSALTSGGLGGITSGAAADAVAGLGSAATSAIGTAGSGLQSAVGTLGSAIGVDTSAVSGAIGSAVQAGTAAVETGTAVATGVLSTVGEVLGPIGALAAIGMGIYDIFSASENHHIDAVAAPTFTAGL